MFLPVLHLFNDGYLAAMPLILPFAADELNISLTLVGLLGSLLSFSGIVLALPAGIAASRFGALRILSAAVLGYAAGFILLGFSSGIITVTLAFLLGSVSFGIFHPIAFSAVAKVSSKSSLGKDMGIFAATGDIGKIALAGLLTFIIGFSSWRTASEIYGCAAILLFLLYFIISHRKDWKVNEKKTEVKRKPDYRILKKKPFALANASSFMDSFANASLFIFIPFLLTFRGIDASYIGIFSSIFFIGNLLGKVIMGRLTDRIRKEYLFIGSEICIFVSLVSLALTPSLTAISTLAFLLGLLTKGTVPITSTMVAESVCKDDFETAFSINSLSTSIANTIAPLFFGFLADYLGVQAIFFACGFAALCSVVPAAVMLKDSRGKHTDYHSESETP